MTRTFRFFTGTAALAPLLLLALGGAVFAAVVIQGTKGPDNFTGTTNNDNISGRGGDDRIDSDQGGKDKADGGRGNDHIDVQGGPTNPQHGGGGYQYETTAGNPGGGTDGTDDPDTQYEPPDRQKDQVDCGKGKEDTALVDFGDKFERCEVVNTRR